MTTLTGSQTPTANVTFTTADAYTFLGAKPSEIAYLLGLSSNLQTQLNGKQASGAYMTTLMGGQTPTANVTFTTPDTFLFLGAKPSEIVYLLGLSSSVQTQLNGKQASGAYI